MKATIISVGNELLNGKTVNTNASYIAKELRSIGMTVTRTIAINDDPKWIFKTLEETTDQVIIFTGGLGSTSDDLTKESVAQYFHLKLYRHEESLNRIRRHFEKSQRKMPSVNEKQAYFPKEALILNNDYGTAPGAIIQLKRQTIVLLPGPPQELIPMFAYVKTYLEERHNETIYQQGYLVAGTSESEMEEQLKPLYTKHPEVTIAPYAGLGEITYMMTSSNLSLLNKAMADFKKLFSLYIVGPYDQSLETIIVERLMAQNQTISFVESCTGGMIASRLINAPNASKVFNESFIFYADQSKIKHLGINQSIIERFGSVSAQCVYELAYQLGQRTDASLTLSVSGIAGPTGGSASKPIGTIYYGIHYEGKTKTYHKIFVGNREMIRQKATAFAYYLMIKTLNHEDIAS